MLSRSLGSSGCDSHSLPPAGPSLVGLCWLERSCRFLTSLDLWARFRRRGVTEGEWWARRREWGLARHWGPVGRGFGGLRSVHAILWAVESWARSVAVGRGISDSFLVSDRTAAGRVVRPQSSSEGGTGGDGLDPRTCSKRAKGSRRRHSGRVTAPGGRLPWGGRGRAWSDGKKTDVSTTRAGHEAGSGLGGERRVPVRARGKLRCPHTSRWTWPVGN